MGPTMCAPEMREIIDYTLCHRAGCCGGLAYIDGIPRNPAGAYLKSNNMGSMFRVFGCGGGVGVCVFDPTRGFAARITYTPTSAHAHTHTQKRTTTILQ